MIRLIFLFILLIHGAIHLIGFVKEFQLAEVSQLSGRTVFPISGSFAKAVGASWGVVTLLFFSAMVILLIRKDWWWILGLLAIFVSQLLVILYWPDARLGTIPNIIVLAGVVVGFGSWDFKQMISREQSDFLKNTPLSKEVVTQEKVESMPPVIQRWVKNSNLLGKEVIQTVFLTQKGRMRTTPRGNWMSFRARQNFRVDIPGFIWVTEVQGSSLMKLVGRDKYLDGKGHMLIRLFSLIPVADAKGVEIDQGTLLRYMGEAVWFPSFALSSYIHWEEIDNLTAKATITYRGVTATGTYRFNSNGDFVSFEAKRYFDRKGGATLEDWLVKVPDNGYKTFQGIRIPAKCEVIWKLKTGDFNWLNLEIEEVQYNKF